jgi:hypothetical protein
MQAFMYPVLSDFRKIGAFWKVPRFRPFVLLVTATRGLNE